MGIQILKLTRVQTNLKIQQRSSQAIKCKIAGQLFCKQLIEAFDNAKFIFTRLAKNVLVQQIEHHQLQSNWMQ